jgi:general secretion pathway protein H
LVSHRHSAPGSITGFTLLELLVVLTIAALLTALVPPLYSNAVPGAKLKTTTRDFAIALREARSSAIARSSQIDLRLLADPPSYAVGSDAAVRLPQGVVITAYDYLASDHASLRDSRLLTDDEILIRFFPDGSSNGAAVKLAIASTAYRVDVSWMMGDIRVSRVADHET